MPPCFIFDLYGTLVDIKTDEQNEDFRAAAAKTFNSLGVNLDKDQIFDVYTKGFEKRRLSPAHEPDAYYVFEEIFERGGVKPTAKMIYAAAWEFRKLSTIKLAVYEKIPRILSELKQKNAPIYLLSNAQALFTMPELRLLGLDKLFDGIGISSEIGYNKPDKRAFDYMLDKYNLSAENCVYVGNDHVCDVEGALNAGLKAVYIKTEQSPPLFGTVQTPYAVNDGDFGRLESILLSFFDK